jgi:hypothetical protein
MTKEESAINIDLVLNELHAKRKWLDTVIAGLESAIQSPDHRLIESLGAAYSNGDSGRPKVDLRSTQQAKLSRLASRVQQQATRKQSERPSNSANA